MLEQCLLYAIIGVLALEPNGCRSQLMSFGPSQGFATVR